MEFSQDVCGNVDSLETELRLPSHLAHLGTASMPATPGTASIPVIPVIPATPDISGTSGTEYPTRAAQVNASARCVKLCEEPSHEEPS